MPLQDNDTYSLTNAELLAFREMAFIQHHFATDMGNKIADDPVGFFSSLNKTLVTFADRKKNNELQNPAFKRWFDEFFTSLLPIEDFSQMFMINRYRDFCQTRLNINEGSGANWTTYWFVFVNGWAPPSLPRIPGGFIYPDYPESWRPRMDAILADWQRSRPGNYIGVGGDFAHMNKEYSQMAEDSMKRYWKDHFNSYVSSVRLLRSNQFALLTRLMKQPTLSLNDYDSLLNLLIVMAQADHESNKLVMEILTQTGDTTTNPNDSFLNHLLFMVCVFHDRSGRNASYLKSRFALLKTCVFMRTTACELLRNGLQQHVDFLTVDAGYPYFSSNQERFSETKTLIDVMRKNVIEIF